jgi:transposase-like protein
MIIQVLHCPYCRGSDSVRHGLSPEGKQRYRCRTCLEGRGRTFLLDYSYAGQSSAVKQQIVDMAMNASGIRDTARVLHVSPTTVINELKKTRVAKSAGVSSSPVSRDRRLDHGESADAGCVAGGESPVPAAALARP